MVTVGITIIERGMTNEIYTIGIETSMDFDEVKALIKEAIDKMPKEKPPRNIPGVETQ